MGDTIPLLPPPRKVFKENGGGRGLKTGEIKPYNNLDVCVAPNRSSYLRCSHPRLTWPIVASRSLASLQSKFAAGTVFAYSFLVSLFFFLYFLFSFLFSILFLLVVLFFLFALFSLFYSFVSFAIYLSLAKLALFFSFLFFFLFFSSCPSFGSLV